ncbi:MAG: hypothetical protein FJ265_00360 [Planctomycetes bacterium]|nr:hypothetical protein [Planctomycetota bacterium]
MCRHLPTFVMAFASTLVAQTATYAVFQTPTLALQPPGREYGLSAYDPVRGRTLLAGGIGPGGSMYIQDTWEWNGTAWQQVFPAYQLDFGRPTQLVWAPQRSQILAVYGSPTGYGQPLEIHAWTGTNWVMIDNTGPAHATGGGAAWDSARGVLVLFNGWTWEWNGSTWATRTTGGPVPRNGFCMAYDSARQRTVLYGGSSYNNASLHDTWEWNGIYWIERFGIPAPDVYINMAMGYDSTRHRMVLHGGRSETTGNMVGNVYEYDGTAWQQCTTQGAPSSMRNCCLAYDEAANCFVMFGGFIGMTYQRMRTITFVTGTVASSSSHGAGCPGPAGTPTLLPVGTSRPVLGTTFQLRFGNLPNTPLAPVFAAIGFQDQSWNGQPLPLDLTAYGLPACWLRIGLANTILLGNVAGTATWPIPLPAGASLDGLGFFVQGAVIAFGWNPAGAVVSDSRRGIAGVL